MQDETCNEEERLKNNNVEIQNLESSMIKLSGMPNQPAHGSSFESVSDDRPSPESYLSYHCGKTWEYCQYRIPTYNTQNGAV